MIGEFRESQKEDEHGPLIILISRYFRKLMEGGVGRGVEPKRKAENSCAPFGIFPLRYKIFSERRGGGGLEDGEFEHN